MFGAHCSLGAGIGSCCSIEVGFGYRCSDYMKFIFQSLSDEIQSQFFFLAPTLTNIKHVKGAKSGIIALQDVLLPLPVDQNKVCRALRLCPPLLNNLPPPICLICKSENLQCAKNTLSKTTPSYSSS